VLFNQFHDIMAGTSLEAAYEDARSTFGEAQAIASRALNHVVQTLAWKIKVEPAEDMIPLVVFNPLTFPSTTNIEIESTFFSPESILLDEQGNVIPHQMTQSSTATWRARLCFTAHLPALGYRTYRMFKQPDPALLQKVQASAHNLVLATDTSLENAHYRLEFNPQTGCIASLYDKTNQVQLFSAPAAHAIVLDDPTDTWSHATLKWDQVIGEFTPTRVYLAEDGPVKSVIRVISHYQTSTLVQDFTMFPDQDQIEVSVSVNWHEQFKMLKLRFPVNLAQFKGVNEIPYGHIERAANGDEEPMQSWVDVSGTSLDKNTQIGLSILNVGKYSMDVNGSDIGLTVLRSPAYAHHTPFELNPNGVYPFIDQGMQYFKYTLLPHTSNWAHAGTIKQAQILNQPPTTLFTTFHSQGSLPQADSFIKVEPENVLVNVRRLAEDGHDLILRAYETTGLSTRASITLSHWNRTIQADFGPCEIKTIRIPVDVDQPPFETNLLEFPT
jgi:alpha-mannosidase